MRNTRLPVSLKDDTWMITDSVSSTNRPPTMASTISCLVATAMAPSAPPSAERAGVAHEDHGRRGVEPQEAETGANQRTADDGELAGALHVVDLQIARKSWRCRTGRRSVRRLAAAIMTGTMASPSRPSVEIDGVAGAGDHQTPSRTKRARRAGSPRS